MPHGLGGLHEPGRESRAERDGAHPAGSTRINVTGLRYSINWLGQYTLAGSVHFGWVSTLWAAGGPEGGGIGGWGNRGGIAEGWNRGGGWNRKKGVGIGEGWMNRERGLLNGGGCVIVGVEWGRVCNSGGGMGEGV